LVDDPLSFKGQCGETRVRLRLPDVHTLGLPEYLIGEGSPTITVIMPSTMLRERHWSCRDLNIRPFGPANSGEWCSIDHFRLSGANKQPKLVTLPALVTYVGWPIKEVSADGDVAMGEADGAGGQEGDRPLEVRPIEIQQRVRAVANDRQFLVGLAGAAPEAALEAFTFHCRITRLQQSLNNLVERGVQAWAIKVCRLRPPDRCCSCLH
jgi:hypothetical protein